jgi:hypothetical protein
MMRDRTAEARELYLVSGQAHGARKYQDLEAAIGDDFRELRQAGITHPMMAEIEQELHHAD